MRTDNRSMRLPFWTRFDKLIEGRKEYLFADSLGIATSTLSTWKNKHRYPGANDAVVIAQALDTTVEYLVTGIEPPGGAVLTDEEKQVLEDLKSIDSNIKTGFISAIHQTAECARREKKAAIKTG